MASAIPAIDIADPAKLPDSAVLREILAIVTRTENSEDHQERLVKVEKDVVNLKKEVYDLKNLVNVREQQLRSRTVRILGFPYTEEEKESTDPKYLARKVHDRLLTPIFNQAKASNLIDRAPQLATAVESCFRLRASTSLTGTAKPPLSS